MRNELEIINNILSNCGHFQLVDQLSFLYISYEARLLNFNNFSEPEILMIITKKNDKIIGMKSFGIY